MALCRFTRQTGVETTLLRLIPITSTRPTAYIAPDPRQILVNVLITVKHNS